MTETRMNAPQRPAPSGSTDWREPPACLDGDPDLFIPVGSAGPSLLQVDRAGIATHAPGHPRVAGRDLRRPHRLASGRPAGATRLPSPAGPAHRPLTATCASTGVSRRRLTPSESSAGPAQRNGVRPGNDG